ncbi:MAG: FG-GAP-like repeat-containing protein, partial [Candidatus Micrarchaeota archaeon]
MNRLLLISLFLILINGLAIADELPASDAAVLEGGILTPTAQALPTALPQTTLTQEQALSADPTVEPPADLQATDSQAQANGQTDNTQPASQPRPDLKAPLKFGQDDLFKTSLFTGAFSYDYPIKAPPGINGLSPNVRISYNHQKANSFPTVMGAGWDLQLSYIEKKERMLISNPRKMDSHVRLVLEGSENELNFSSDGRYHTTIETYLLIVNQTTNQNQGGTYWIVKSKDGTKYIFGSKNSSEQVSNVSGLAERWYLDQIIDTSGNSIFFNYQENPNSEDLFATYLKSIEYNNEKSRQIVFDYESQIRPDIQKVFVNLDLTFYSRRLIDISTKANGVLVSRHHFAYANPGFSARSYLANITEIGSDNSTSLPSTSFEYFSSTGNWILSKDFIPPYKFKNTADTGLRAFDANGDGLIDLLLNNGSINRTWLNNGTGWNETFSYLSPVQFTTGPNDNAVREIDINGDGLIDLMHDIQDLKARDGNCKYAGSRYSHIWLNNGTGWNETNKWVSPYPNMDGTTDTGARIFDVNGDGLPDVLVGSSTDRFGSDFCTFINNGTGWVEDDRYVVPERFAVDWKDWGVRPVDFNADGLIDLVQSLTRCYNTCTSIEKVWINTGNGFVLQDSPKSPYPFTLWTDAGTAGLVLGPDLGSRLMDANGDGLTDVVVSQINNNFQLNYGTWLSNGNEWVRTPDFDFKHPFSNQQGWFEYGLRTFDANGDGLDDVVFANQSWNGTLINANSKAYLMSKI